MPSVELSPLLCRWMSPVVRDVCPRPERHTIHAYFTGSPESPDGNRALYFSSTERDAQHGEVCVLDPRSGQETVLLGDVGVEDAHRVACQQWVGGGQVVFHALREGNWQVILSQTDGSPARVMARDRQVGWSQPHSRYVPLNGLHWDQSSSRDLEMLDINTGVLETVVTAEAVWRAYPQWVEEKFGDKPISIYFPILSPDLRRVMFKLAAPGGGDWQSPQASQREGLVVYDLERQAFLSCSEQWGHPSWHPDSRHIVNVPGVLFDTRDNSTRELANTPVFLNAHPSLSPDGDLFLTDTILEPWQTAQRGFVLGDLTTGQWAQIHQFDHSGGATSWRPSHPHPVFDSRGKRIHYNAGSGLWTRLHVAEPEEYAYSF